MDTTTRDLIADLEREERRIVLRLRLSDLAKAIDEAETQGLGHKRHRLERKADEFYAELGNLEATRERTRRQREGA